MSRYRSPFRVQPHFRRDGRFVEPAKRLEFRAEHDVFRLEKDNRGLLIPGLLIGAAVRYHWTENRPTIRWFGDKGVPTVVGSTLHEHGSRVYMTGLYTGEDMTVELPVYKWHPQGKHADTCVPLFEMTVHPDMYRRIDIGQVAIACMAEEERVIVGQVDHARIQEALGIKNVAENFKQFLGEVILGSLSFSQLPA